MIIFSTFGSLLLTDFKFNVGETEHFFNKKKLIKRKIIIFIEYLLCLDNLYLQTIQPITQPKIMHNSPQ